MSEFFRPYEGSKPFLFISYAHRDTERVLPVIRLLHDGLYRLWYDEGIPAGSDWPRNIAEHMQRCSRVLFFVSAASIASKNCLMEIQKAKSLHKPVLCIRFDGTALPEVWREALAGAEEIPADRAPEALAERILGGGFVTEDFLGDGVSDGDGGGKGGGFNGWIVAIILGVLLLIAAGAGIFGLQNGWFAAYLPEATPAPTARPTPSPTPTAAPTFDAGAWAGTIGGTVSFEDPVTERAVRKALNRDEGEILSEELLTVTALHLCGGSVLKSDLGIAYDDTGNCFVNGAKVARGSVEKLGVYGDMGALTELTLAYQSIADVADLGGLTLLARLNLSGNDTLTDIAGLTGNVSLTALDVSHTKVKDLTPLNGLPALTAVSVSPDMFPLITEEKTQRYDILLVP